MDLTLKYCIWHSQILQRDELSIVDLDGHFGLERPAYLYCILSKNRISINNKKINFTDSHVNVEFLIQDKDATNTESLQLAHNYTGLQELKVISDFPHNKFTIIDEFGSTLYGGKAAYFPEHSELYNQVKNKNFLDYEILYIGQSVLSDKNIPALDRTAAHETYQKILEEYNQSHYDKELFLFFMSFKQDAEVYIPETVNKAERSNFIENFKKNYFNSSLKEIRNNVTLLEASLINYFKPKYNSDYVNHPPNKSHSAVGELSKMNLKKVKILFGIKDFAPVLYTATSGRKDEYHIEHDIN